jgi:regulator of RNase E activity RraA
MTHTAKRPWEAAAGGDLRNALVGELMVTYAISRGVAGFVMKGAIRDVDWLRPTPRQ